jgi:hypothetical protein
MRKPPKKIYLVYDFMDVAFFYTRRHAEQCIRMWEAENKKCKDNHKIHGPIEYILNKKGE